MTKEQHSQLVPMNIRCLLTLSEASEYSGLEKEQLIKITAQDGCDFVLWTSNARLIKRKPFEKYLDKLLGVSEEMAENICELETVPLRAKVLLTVDEAVLLTGLNRSELEDIIQNEQCDFAFTTKTRRLFKRSGLEKFISENLTT